MTWAGLADVEPITLVGSGLVLHMGVSEHAPTSQAATDGQTMQRFKLLSLDGERLVPPARVVVRDSEMRVLGTQAPPWAGAPSIVTCELVNPDLPDDVSILGPASKDLDDVTGRFTDNDTARWSGAAHVVTGVPATVESAGVDTPLDKATITLPLEAPYAEGLRVRIVTSRTPGVPGRDFVMSGEVLDSSASLRRVVCYRSGR